MNSEYRIGELAENCGVSKRTIHYYISRGLIPPPYGSGLQSYYGEDHLLRVKLIKKMQERYLPLDEIKSIIVSLSLDEVKEQLENFNYDSCTVKEPAMNGYEFPDEDPGDEYVRIYLGYGVEINYPRSLPVDKVNKIKSIVEYFKNTLK